MDNALYLKLKQTSLTASFTDTHDVILGDYEKSIKKEPT